eukprot:GHVU01133222.1.p3 GENE.GHVU01133222.1~~GHVU01133222.1.p3  ORF type:complete len:133 (+),score=7.41 GHVU01133222.1:356-754(+)
MNVEVRIPLLRELPLGLRRREAKGFPLLTCAALVEERYAAAKSREEGRRPPAAAGAADTKRPFIRELVLRRQPLTVREAFFMGLLITDRNSKSFLFILASFEYTTTMLARYRGTCTAWNGPYRNPAAGRSTN